MALRAVQEDVTITLSYSSRCCGLQPRSTGWQSSEELPAHATWAQVGLSQTLRHPGNRLAEPPLSQTGSVLQPGTLLTSLSDLSLPAA